MAPHRPSISDMLVDRFLSETPLPTSAPHPCPYLPDQIACSKGFEVGDELDAGVHQALIHRGFRRSGHIIYKPTCQSCNACIPIRVPAETFTASRSMRRTWRRNADIIVTPGSCTPDAEKHDLFVRYLEWQHDGTMSTDYDDFEQFLYDSPAPTEELLYHAGRRLLGVSIIDPLPDGLSSVYMFFDPEEGKRSLGTYSVVREIDLCRSRNLPYYYLGYWVPGSRTMAYKARFRPAEVLAHCGRWIPLADWESQSSLATLPTA